MNQPPSILISCGEPSGDLYAASLASELRRLAPDVRLAAMGGEHLREAGVPLVADYRGLTVTGLVEALGVLPRLWAIYRRLVAFVRRSRPDVVVVIDFPDFHFPLARAVRRLGVPLVYYVPPQLWAWRRGRIKSMQRMVDATLVIFPFEPDVYRRAGVPVEFVGHPLLDLAAADAARGPFLESVGLDPARRTVALLPGSRPNELRLILPGLVAGARLIVGRLPDVQFVVARAPGLDDDVFRPLEACGDLRLALVERRADAVLASADVALTASGTATVQAAIHGTPMVVVYRLAPLTYALARRIVKVDTVGMVNLVAGRRVVPELIQDAFTPEAVADEACRLLTNPDEAATMRAALADVCHRLGDRGASRRAAEAVLRVARRATPSS